MSTHFTNDAHNHTHRGNYSDNAGSIRAAVAADSSSANSSSISSSFAKKSLEQQQQLQEEEIDNPSSSGSSRLESWEEILLSTMAEEEGAIVSDAPTEPRHSVVMDAAAAAALVAADVPVTSSSSSSVKSGKRPPSKRAKKSAPKKASSSAAAKAAAAAISAASASSASNSRAGLKHKRRYCKAPGCERIVKSQGLCQRHGAKPRKCKIETCKKQAQGNFDGMCKSHFKSYKRATTPLPPKPQEWEQKTPPPPEGTSVYDKVIPESLAWKHTMEHTMPLVAHLKQGFDAVKPPAWHRNEERRARGLWPVHNPATQLEGWERELVWTEILLLTGNSQASFRHLARGWGRDKGFHMVLAQYICKRRGDVQRKKRERMEAEQQEEDDDEDEDQEDSDDEQDQPMEDAATAPFAVPMDHPQYHPHHAYLPPSEMPLQGPGKLAAAAASKGERQHQHNNHNSEYSLLDDAHYGDAAYNEALAADILNLAAGCDDFGDMDPTASAQAPLPPAQPSKQQKKQQQQLLAAAAAVAAAPQQGAEDAQYCQVIQPQYESGLEADDDLSEDDNLIAQYYSSGEDDEGMDIHNTATV